MKAALTYGPFDVRVEDVPEPTPGPGQVKVKISYCGICGTDPDIYDGTFGLLKAPWWPKPPFTTGHEAAGVIAELGPGLLEGYKVGQRVAMNFRTYCGVCYYCRNKLEQMCEHVTSYEAGFSEYALYGEGAVYPLPDDVSLERGGYARAGHHRAARGRPGQPLPRQDGGHLWRWHYRPVGTTAGHPSGGGPRARVGPHA